jgi:YHS domain-containing protein
MGIRRSEYRQDRSKDMKTEKTARFYLTGILSLAVILTVYGGGVLANQEGQPQKLCPIMGGEIDKSAYTDYEGKRVYFCCPGCKATFMEKPDKYIEDMESKGIVLERVPQAKTGDEGRHEVDPGAHPSCKGPGNHAMHSGSMH